ncbi:MAG: LytTR family DNA-binding domain-containing protein [Lachnospiraceae bacterium]|nr:LytTR family DNA-binding domain-containing protein [Lachnospiraceae bacterium]MDD3614720.1 LytTR family DNA-binding domain-containing protein [Lachnospiraceae bacterium]
MLQIGICDDQKQARLTLRWTLERLLERREIQGQINTFFSGEGLLEWMKKYPGELDLVFLDIEMPKTNGMDVARKLREADSGLQLVFVTGYADYVYDGYSVGALGYLLKPAKEEKLNDILTRALAALYRNSTEVYVCRNKDSFYRILRTNILYFASDKRQIQCVTNECTYHFYKKLDEVEQELSGGGFVRIHQRYLVRAGAVEYMDSNEVTLHGGTVLPISRSCQASAMAALTRALLE